MKTKNSKICVALAGSCLIIGGTTKVISSIYEMPKLDLVFGISWVIAGVFLLISLYLSKRNMCDKNGISITN